MGMYIKKDILEGETLYIECINGKYVALSEEDGEHYEIVVVPKPHGRLIDAKKALAKVIPPRTEDTKQSCTIFTTKRLIFKVLRTSETVIEAEE